MIKPTIGRIVHFRPYAQEPSADPQPAIITHVTNDTTIHICAFTPDGRSYGQKDVYLFSGEGERPKHDFAEWMPYQHEQAKAAEASSNK